MKKQIYGASLALAACAVIFTSRGAIAQGTGIGQPTSAESLKVDLEAESSSIYDALKQIFKQTKLSFTIDESLRSLKVTAHLTQVPFRIALDKLLKSTSVALTCSQEDGVYVVKVSTDQSIPSVALDTNNIQHSDHPDSSRSTVRLIRVYNLSDLDIVQAFGGTILNLGYIPSLSGGTSQNQRSGQTGSFFQGGENLTGTGHGNVIVTSGSSSAGAKP